MSTKTTTGKPDIAVYSIGNVIVLIFVIVLVTCAALWLIGLQRVNPLNWVKAIQARRHQRQQRHHHQQSSGVTGRKISQPISPPQGSILFWDTERDHISFPATPPRARPTRFARFNTSSSLASDTEALLASPASAYVSPEKRRAAFSLPDIHSHPSTPSPTQAAFRASKQPVFFFQTSPTRQERRYTLLPLANTSSS